MIIKRRRHRSVPGLNTASLPDLIFTVLFFFMIVTHMRNVTPKVQYSVPKGGNLTNVKKKSSIVYIYIGKAKNHNKAASNHENNVYLIQVGDKIVDINGVKDYIKKEQSKLLPDDAAMMTVSIKADRDCPMSIINSVKQQLREANALRINYNATSQKDNK